MIRQPTGLSVNRMIGRLLRLPPEAKSACRLRGDTLAHLSPERMADLKDCIAEGAGNPALLLGTAATPWNNASITDGSHAQKTIDLAVNASSEYWPKLENLIGELVQRTGIRPPETLEQTAVLVKLFAAIRYVLDKYNSQVFSKNLAELAEALKPGIGSAVRAVWAFISDSRYRCARKSLLSCRKGSALVSTLLEEALFADDVLRRWWAFDSPQEIPSAYDDDEKVAIALTALTEATNVGSSIPSLEKVRSGAEH